MFLLSEAPLYHTCVAPGIWGYNFMCKVTPVILHGVCNVTLVILHGVVCPQGLWCAPAPSLLKLPSRKLG